MLRASLLGLLLLTPTPMSSLSVEVPDPHRVVAGERVTLPVTVQLTGPDGEPLPGLAGPVELDLDAANRTGCRLTDRQLLLDPRTGTASTELACRPTRPAAFPLGLTARSPPHAPGSWTGELTVDPDELAGELRAGPANGSRIPLTLELAPEHLEKAAVNLTLEGRLNGSELGFAHGPIPFSARQGARYTRALETKHGPGTYEITVTGEGPAVLSFAGNATVEVPPEPEDDEHVVHAQVEPTEPTVQLTGDGVNRDGIDKYPGQALTTRLTVERTDEVGIRVLRGPVGEEVPIGEQALPVPADGEVEHVLEEPVLPAGRLVVEASAGNASTRRTAEIQDAAPEAQAEPPTPVLADGRPLAFELVVSDANFGSMPADPGPVHGLPDVDWTVYDHNRVSAGWRVALGLWANGSEGTAPLSTVPWPNGTGSIEAASGSAQVPVNLTPPRSIEAGSYRLSVYEAGEGDLLTTVPIDLLPTPTVVLDPGVPVPGEPWPVRVSFEDPGEDVGANLTVRYEARVLDRGTIDGNGTVELSLPSPLAAGAEITLEATGRWPGRPSPEGPDTSIEVPVADVGPGPLELAPNLDGVRTPPPLPLNPASNHTIEPGVPDRDPNGDPIRVDAHLLDPNGERVPGTASTSADGQVSVPAGLAPGRYQLAVEAHSPGGGSQAVLPVDVGEITRVRLDGPDEVTVPAGGQARLALTVRNAGNVPLGRLLLSAQAEEINLSAKLDGEPVPWGTPFPAQLPPGQEQALELTVRAAADVEGRHTIKLRAAGGPG